MRYFFERTSRVRREPYKSMVIGVYVGIITGAWIYVITKDTYDEYGSKIEEKDVWKLAIFTGVINGFFYAAATGALDS